ncbi:MULTISPECIES: glycosyltransferase family 4 protein [Legionella]|uniref:Glycosyl transferase group 1 n=1 Tax=Legionella maceachernii TaxID=466 RepID=A0A0W0VVU1_9GAMM|nr:glycosyltransferase family 1 protein [Legionella maceachernii]KTD24165.1 glycosyl transferase group 1 [Legionella maceachernii]SJZ87831.1 Glycosyltransferase involved in cell wall bisynthesis [Legionella maceachernii]SUO98820.1 D-inositol-3-phosphate glycosyltransferase [Legionella maceachernii]
MPTNKMHIGFDISQTGSGKAGCGFFAHAMIQAMLEIAPEHRYSLYPSFGDFFFDALMPIQNPYKKGHYGPRHLTREMASAFWSKQDIENTLGSPDIVHSNNFWCPTQFKSSRLIYTFYDMGFVVNPNWSTEANRLGCFSGVFNSSLAADWVVAISKASRDHYLSIFPHFPEDRIRVIYPCSRFTNGQHEGKRPKALKNCVAEKFWLNVGTIEPRKNQRCLAKAYARYLALNGEPMPLVFAGGEGWLMDDFKKYLHELDIESHVIFTGYVSDEELIWLYQNCYANLYCSLFEGFGLPILEGMQFGAPTLNSLSTSMPEIAGQATILLPAENTEDWAQAMLRLASNRSERERLSLVAQEQANKFSWEQSAALLLELYEEALAAPKRRELKNKVSPAKSILAHSGSGK